MKPFGFVIKFGPKVKYDKQVCARSRKLKYPIDRGGLVASLRSSAMKGKFGGKQPTGTPSMAWSTVVVVFSLLSGASVVHNFFNPDLTLPPIDTSNEAKMQQRGKD
ncbi:hypothetical protein SSX86_006459 [Deinandra increscens subsp. villosa]|uniref:Uncharacterized protein n=1 Tax=Deinandra increscens subsp. villosa TaxID=3103831 RepID=A0AAP0DIR6_9ASTR